MAKISDVFTEGAGPFATPLLARFRGLERGDSPAFAIAEFEFEDGTQISIPISAEAAQSLNATLSAWLSTTPPKTAQRH